MDILEESGHTAVEAAEAPEQACADGGREDMPIPKSTSPAFQFYPKDFLSSPKVGRMSMTERGVYITLLSYCWLDNGIPDDVGQLAKLAGMKQPQFAKMWAGPLHECFAAKNGRLFNDRLNLERQKQIEFRRRQTDAADKRWEKARHKSGNATASSRHPSGNASHIPDPISQIASTANAVARTPIHTSHRSHAACGRTCVPATLHSEFVRRRNHPAADMELRDWYLAIDREWVDGGPHANAEPGDSFVFWKARYGEKWPVAAAAAPVAHDNRPQWVRDAEARKLARGAAASAS